MLFWYFLSNPFGLVIACFGCLLVYLLLSGRFLYLKTFHIDVDDSVRIHLSDTLRLFSIFGFQGTDSSGFYSLDVCASSGDGEIRTLDPLLARQVLSQLSYAPISDGSLSGYGTSLVQACIPGLFSASGLKWTRTTDLTLIRRAL